MCWSLFKKELRSGCKLALIFAAVLSMYTLVIITMFDPELGESLRLMEQSMPELFALFDMQQDGSTLLHFMATYLYGFLYILLPLVWVILLVRQLLVRYVDRGAMAWLLASPVPRRRIARNQLAVLVLWMVAAVGYLSVLSVAAGEGMFPGALDIPAMLRLNAGLLGLLLALASVCWLGGCLFDDGGLALGSGGGLCVLFVLLKMLSGAGEGAEFCRYLTPLTLFDTNGLIAGEAGALGGVALLYAAAVLLFTLGVEVFARKDMSL